jgi:hypothetical protein
MTMRSPRQRQTTRSAAVCAPLPRSDRCDGESSCGRLPPVVGGAVEHGGGTRLPALQPTDQHGSYCRVVNAGQVSEHSLCRAETPTQLAVLPLAVEPVSGRRRHLPSAGPDRRFLCGRVVIRRRVMLWRVCDPCVGECSADRPARPPRSRLCVRVPIGRALLVGSSTASVPVAPGAAPHERSDE